MTGEKIIVLSSRRKFLKNVAVGSAAAGSMELLPVRILSAESSGPNAVVYRNLGSTGYRVSEVGFGAMNTRDAELIHAAIDAGINYIDTAHGYMGGVNEEIIGQVLRTKRDKVFITTKVDSNNPDEIPAMIETSLKRLNTDHVDLLLLHGLSQRAQILNNDLMKMFGDARKKGQTRFVGFSNHSNHAESLDLAVESKFWQAVCVGYNHTSPPEVTESIQKAREAGLAIIAMKTQVKGRGYSDKSTENVSPQQAALKWVLQNRFVDTTIPGMTSFEQLREDVAVMGMKITFDDNRTRNHYSRYAESDYCRGAAGCTGCLGACPHGVAVSDINRCVGYADGYGDFNLALENYRELPRSSRIDRCSDCTECAVKCINGINLNESIQRAHELFT